MAEGVGGPAPVSIAWYLAVSAIVFSLGAVGVITRRNPLVVLLCLELMLNGANLALIAFSRMWGNGDGQILALIVMTVAACEVCIGLGMIVAIYRRRLPIDVDELRELQGDERHDVRLARAAVPAARHARHRVRLPLAARPQRRVDRHGRDRPRVPRGARRADRAAGPCPHPPRARLLAVELRLDGRHRRAAVDPRRPAVGVHDPDRHRRLDDDPPLLGLLPGRRPRLRPLLLLPELLRLLDAAARARGQLPAADRRLGVRRRRLLPADLLLVPAHDRHERGDQGVRDQRRRRRRARARHVLHLQAHRHARLPRHLQGRAARLPHRAKRTSSPAACCCSSARSRSPRRSRCTPGCPTRWRARPRSAR